MFIPLPQICECHVVTTCFLCCYCSYVRVVDNSYTQPTKKNNVKFSRVCRLNAMTVCVHDDAYAVISFGDADLYFILYVKKDTGAVY